jgi:hypothetical protein
MSTSATPYGLRPITHNSADVRPRGIDGAILSGYTSAIYFNSPVVMSTTGTLNVATTTSLICGTFAGCRYKPDSTSLYVESQYFPANQTYVAGTMTAYVIGYDDQQVLYRMQGNGSMTQDMIGAQSNPVNPSSGQNQFSVCSLNSTVIAAGSSGTFRILDIYPSPNNSWGDSYTEVIVQIAAHQFYPAIVGI